MELAKITLRLATSKDVDFISRLIETTMRCYVEQTCGSFSRERTRQTVQEAVASQTYSVIEFQGEDIGALAVEREPTHIQLAQIYVSPAYQNRGVGTHLIRELIREAMAAARPLRVRVLAVNPVRKLYEREGFVVTSVTPERVFMERHA